MRISPPPISAFVASVFLLASPLCSGLIFFDTGDPTHNREVAPGGAWGNSGWQFQGEYKDFLGTMISPRHFITAIHLGLGETTFVHKAFFSGEASDRVYHINPNFNSGAGFKDLPGTDLRIFEVYGDFPAYAPLFTASNEVGKDVVLMGRGRPRGVPVTLMSQTRGWRWGPIDLKARWGTNKVDSTSTIPSRGEMLITDFDDLAGTDECHAASGDSGGALFIEDAGTWKLAGIMYAVDGRYDTNTICGDGSDFSAAMFNARDFYLGEDNANCDDWTKIRVSNDLDESRTYSSRISDSASAIQTTIQPALDDALKTPIQRFDEWLAELGVTSETLPGEDADHDEWPNVIEYLNVLNPNGADSERGFVVQELPGKIRFRVRVRLDAAARGLSWEIQGADDLVAKNYTAVTGMTEVGVSRSLVEGVETIEYEINRPAGPHMFYRLQATLAP